MVGNLLYALVLVLSIQERISEECQEDWVSTKDKCLRLLETTKVSSRVCEKGCGSVEAYVACIDNEYEMSLAVNRLASEDFWVAIYKDIREEKNFGFGRDVHCNSFESDAYYPWGPGAEAENPGEECVTVSSEKEFEKVKCSAKKFCLCEKSKQSKTQSHRVSHVVAKERQDEVYLTESAGRRNHGCAVIENKLYSILGRWAESTEYVSLEHSGEPILSSCDSSLGNENYGLCNLNHVVAIPVRKLHHENEYEVWLPCGFEGHRVGGEESTKRMRIFDPTTFEMRYGPAVAVAGGACAAVALPTERDVDGLICAFGGTDGNHDTGKFLNDVRCYDRRARKWVSKFQSLPVGLDHANAAYVPKDACTNVNDSSLNKARVLVANFRSDHYANMRTEVFGVDLDTPEHWRVFANDTGSLPRDAAGAVLTPNNRFLIEFGGVYYIDTRTREARDRILSELKDAIDLIGARVGKASFKALTQTYHTRLEFDEVRALDLCGSGHWLHLGQMSHPRFATQSCVSEDRVFTCGGTTGGWPKERYQRIDILRSWKERTMAKNYTYKDLRKRSWLGTDRGNFADCDTYSVDELTRKATAAANLLHDVRAHSSNPKIFETLNNLAAADFATSSSEAGHSIDVGRRLLAASKNDLIPGQRDELIAKLAAIRAAHHAILHRVSSS